MGKSTKTYEERIQEKDLRIEKLAQELKRYEAQKKQLEKRRKEEERKIRTHRLIEIGAAVESVLGRCIELEEIPKLIAFLNKQEANGKFFSKAMQKGPDTDMKKEEVGPGAGVCSFNDAPVLIFLNGSLCFFIHALPRGIKSRASLGGVVGELFAGNLSWCHIPLEQITNGLFVRTPLQLRNDIALLIHESGICPMVQQPANELYIALYGGAV